MPYTSLYLKSFLRSFYKHAQLAFQQAQGPELCVCVLRALKRFVEKKPWEGLRLLQIGGVLSKESGLVANEDGLVVEVEQVFVPSLNRAESACDVLCKDDYVICCFGDSTRVVKCLQPLYNPSTKDY